MNPRAILRLSLYLACALSSACTHTGAKDKLLPASDVTNAARKWGLLSVYPNGQDLWIGDIIATSSDYATWAASAAEGNPQHSIRAGFINAAAPLQLYYADRPLFSGPNKERRTITIGKEIYYLRPVVLPNFKANVSKSFSIDAGASASAVVPLASVQLSGGRESEETVVYSADDVTSIGLPPFDARFRKLWAYDRIDGRALREDALSMSRVDVENVLGCDRKSGPGECIVHFILVYEVYYANKINVAVSSSKKLEFGARGSANLPLQNAIGGALRDVQSTIGGLRGTVSDSLLRELTGKAALPLLARPLPLQEATAVANRVTSLVDDRTDRLVGALDRVAGAAGLALGLGAKVGGGFRYVNSTDRTVFLEANLDEPVAIGYRGITFEWNVRSQTPPQIAARGYEPPPIPVKTNAPGLSIEDCKKLKAAKEDEAADACFASLKNK